MSCTEHAKSRLYATISRRHLNRNAVGGCATGLTLKSAAIEPTLVPGLVGSAIEFLERAGGGSKRVSDQAMAGSNSTRSNAKCLARLTIEEVFIE
jgi:hypothetical protein